MAFTVEDGTGLTNANAYITVAEFKAFHDDRGNDYATDFPDDAAIQKAIVSATDYIDNNNSFKGCREFPENPQALAFPRTDICYDGEELPTVPNQLKNACAEYAIRATPGTTLQPDPEIDDSGRVVTKVKEVIGPIEEEKEWSDSSSANFIIKHPYPEADNWLKPLTKNSNRLYRA